MTGRVRSNRCGRRLSVRSSLAVRRNDADVGHHALRIYEELEKQGELCTKMISAIDFLSRPA